MLTAALFALAKGEMTVQMCRARWTFILYTHKGILLLKGQVQQEWQPLLTAPALAAWAEAGGLPELRKES